MPVVIREHIFNGRINQNILTIEEPTGTPVPWTDVTSMVVFLIPKTGSGNPVEISSVTAPTAITFATAGQVKFNLGNQGIPAGTYKIELVAVNTGGDETQIIQWDRDRVEFVVHDTQSVT